jgi:hypothetical protein
MGFRFRGGFNPLTYDQTKGVVTDDYFTRSFSVFLNLTVPFFKDILSGEHYNHILQF